VNDVCRGQTTRRTTASGTGEACRPQSKTGFTLEWTGLRPVFVSETAESSRCRDDSAVADTAVLEKEMDEWTQADADTTPNRR
jgi:hypothetical protein